MADDADRQVKDWLGGRADVVMSDMAAASSGHKQTDHLRIVALCEAAAELAFDVLEPGGTFVAKVLAGGAEQNLQAVLKRNFAKVANVKPPASRADSSEKFVVATGFRGRRDLPGFGQRQPQCDRGPAGGRQRELHGNRHDQRGRDGDAEQHGDGGRAGRRDRPDTGEQYGH